jgi:hypothetical protein
MVTSQRCHESKHPGETPGYRQSMPLLVLVPVATATLLSRTSWTPLTSRPGKSLRILLTTAKDVTDDGKSATTAQRSMVARSDFSSHGIYFSAGASQETVGEQLSR